MVNGVRHKVGTFSMCPFFLVKEKERVCLNFYPCKLNILSGVGGRRGVT